MVALDPGLLLVLSGQAIPQQDPAQAAYHNRSTEIRTPAGVHSEMADGHLYRGTKPLQDSLYGEIPRLITQALEAVSIALKIDLANSHTIITPKPWKLKDLWVASKMTSLRRPQV